MSEILQIAIFFSMIGFVSFLIFMALLLWKEISGDKNWALRMWVRYVMKEVPRESEDDIVSLLKRNTLK